MRARFVLAAAFATAFAAVHVATVEPRFYDDDPIAREPESRDASGAKPLGIDLFFEYAFNLFVNASRPASNTRAMNVNTIDEVPDSSWFTNRVGALPLSADDIARGPNSEMKPAPEQWVLLREKAAGTNAGFTARDANGQTWFLQFDKPEYPEASTGSVEVGTKIFWALGYNQVETFVTTFDPARAIIDPSATMKRPSGARTRFTRKDLEAVLELAPRSADGTYRVSAGRLIAGKVLGNFRYAGTRSDDPNDLVPHEHRRELRALRVFGAWMNLVDLKAGNTLDALADVNGRSVIKHYLQDVGSSLGVANDPGVWDMGWEYFYEGDPMVRRLLSFGFALSPWQTVPYIEYPSVGRFEGDRFDPATWKPQTPAKAYMELRADDAFWAAQRVAAFTDDLIRAAVHTGEFSDPAAERHLAAVLITRRDAIARTYLPAVNPIADPKLDSTGRLTFRNAAVDAGVARGATGYRAAWARFDNATGATRPLGETSSTIAALPPPPELMPTPVGSFIEVDVAADSEEHAAWRQPVRTFFRRTADGWKLVGLERLPREKPPASASPVRVASDR